jgi:putative mRNA 3-end processing factor
VTLIRLCERPLPHERIGWANGILVDTGKSRLLFDPIPGGGLRKQLQVFVTHAHSDHTYGFRTAAKKYSTKETLQIYQALRDREVQNSCTLKVGEKIRVEDSEVSVLNAGHMLGSCQYEVVAPGFTAIYTGDINCIDTLTTQAAEVRSCDYLIMEATYGHPAYVFPRRSTMYADIVSWTMTEIRDGKIPTFQVYSSGKPQEVVRLFNVYTKIPVVCSPTIARASHVHTENGVKLEYLDSSAPEGKRMLRTGACVYVATNNDHLPRHASRAVATGWAIHRAFRKFTSFPLSSHADHDQLVEYVRKVNPKRVYVFTGYSDVLAAEIERKLGIRAGPLPAIAQTKLLDFSETIT